MPELKLACGCIPGEFRCPEAVRLWNEVERTYENYKAKHCEGSPLLDEGSAWLENLRAVNKYKAHFPYLKGREN